MATMNLRTSMKSRKLSNLSKNDKYLTPLHIKSAFLEQAAKFEAQYGPSVHLLSDLKLAASTTNIEEQLNLLKKMTKSSRDNIHQTPLINFHLKLIIDLYINASPNNPIKFALSRLLELFPEDVHKEISELIAYHLSDLIDSKDYFKIEEINFTIHTINMCMDFSVGINSIYSILFKIIEFFEKSFELLLEKFNNALSPASKMSICIDIHLTCQTLVTIIQKFHEHLKESYILKENELNLRYNNLIGYSASLISQEEIPIDTKAISGMILISIFKLLNRDYIIFFAPEEKCIINEYNLSEDSSKINIYIGIINIINIQELCTKENISNQSIISNIINNFIEMAKRNTMDSINILSINRGLLTLIKKISNFIYESQAEIFLLQIEEICLNVVQEILDFIWAHLEHYMDSVRHCSKNILYTFIKLANHLNDKKLSDITLLQRIQDGILSISNEKKYKYISLSVLVSIVGCQTLLNRNPTLIENIFKIFKKDKILPHVSSCLEILISKNFQEVPITNWYDNCISLISSTHMDAPEITKIILEDLLSKALKLCPDLIYFFIPPVKQQKSDYITNLTENLFYPYNLRLTLTCLKIARKQGTFDSSNSYSSSWKGIISFTLLEESLYHQVDQIRLSALSLIIDGRKSTEIFTKQDLSLLRTFLLYNINIECTSTRKQTLALIKKVIVRFKDSVNVILRQLNKTEDYNETKNSMDNYKIFLQWLIEFCYSNLFPGANFSRRKSALQILVWYQDIIGFSQDHWSETWSIMYSSANANILLESLKDTYENNKMLAYELLKNCTPETIGFNDIEFGSRLLQVALSLASSHRPPDCITASYIIKTLASFPTQVKHILSFLGFEESNEICGFYGVILLLTNHLEEELKVAKKNLLLASSKGPMYGLLTCIRYLIQDLDIREISKNQQNWSNWFSKVIQLCFNLNNVVGVIVNNSSPEGHLPMDFNTVNLGTIDQSTESTNSDDVKGVTAQMVLLCAWRTVKEVSLFLGEIAEKIPTEINNHKKFLKGDQLILIGEHLSHLLSEIQHRGAFEQAYVGFCQVAARMRRDPCPEVQQRGRMWLEELFNSLENELDTEIAKTATRRSAGLPFIVQALLTTELGPCGDRSIFQQSLSRLLKIAESANVLESRVHSLNILRALFRHAQLGEHVTPYVAEALILAVNGFSSKAWPERNSATLLFSSLITRMFGVPTKSTSSNSSNPTRPIDSETFPMNRMTGRVFFYRYPTLFEFFQNELKEASKTMNDESLLSLHPRLYPILLVLTRLYPSSLEGTDSTLQLNIYIPLVQACSSSPIYKIRELASRAMVALITPNIFIDHVNKLFIEIFSTAKSQNTRHGLLLQLVNLLKTNPSIIEPEIILKNLTEEKWISKFLDILYENQFSWLSLDLILQILIIIYKFDNQIFINFKSKLGEFLFKIISKKSSSTTIGLALFLSRAAELLLLLNSQTELMDSDLLTILISQHNYELNLVALDYLLNLEPSLFMNNTNLERALTEEIDDPDEYPEKRLKRYRVLQYFVNWLNKPDCFDQLLGFCENFNEHESFISGAILPCINSLLKNFNLNECKFKATDLSRLTKILMQYTLSEYSHECRNAIAEIFCTNWHLLLFNESIFSDLERCSSWSALLTLVQDDESYIREKAISILAQESNNYINPFRKATDPTLLCVVPLRAYEIFLQTFVSTMLDKAPLECSTALIAWCLHDPFPNQELDSGVGVFDKGEMNIYAELVPVIDLITDQLRTSWIYQKDINEVNLPDSLKEWLNLQCGILHNGSLKELIENLKQNPLSNSSSISKSFNGIQNADHFLVPDHNKYLLDIYKFTKIIEATSS